MAGDIESILRKMELEVSPLLTETDYESFLALMINLKPTGNEIVKILTYNYSDDGLLFGLEERVGGYLDDFLVTCTSTGAAMFLRYVTVGECMPGEVVIEFDIENNKEHTMPTVRTCSDTLILSRYFLTYYNLKSRFEDVMKVNGKSLTWNRAYRLPVSVDNEMWKAFCILYFIYCHLGKWVYSEEEGRLILYFIFF